MSAFPYHPDMLRAILAVLLLSASTLVAQPTVQSISPSAGPTSGGTVVTITGTGFSMCPICSPPLPPDVFFGDFPSPTINLVSDTTIQAVVPAQVAGEVFVTVDQYNGRSAPGPRFTYQGSSEAAVERFLLPIYMPPVRGAFGSEFRTDFRILNRGRSLARLWGLRSSTSAFVDVPRWSGTFEEQDGDRPSGPGRFIDVTRDALPDLAMNLRAFDVSRSDTNFGTEIPIVRDEDFEQQVTLIGVPLDPRYRLTLRIYGVGSGYNVYVVAGNEGRNVPLRSPRDGNDPAYAEITFFPPPPVPGASPTTTTITVQALEPITSPPMFPKPRVWAFVTVTNNETQHITTITPQ